MWHVFALFQQRGAPHLDLKTNTVENADAAAALHQARHGRGRLGWLVARGIAACKLALMMRRMVLSILFAATCLAGAFAADAKLHYVNVWYGYAIDLPAGFSAVKESDNGDGGVSYSPDRKSKLAVWGANTMIDLFQSDINDRMSGAQDEGWAIGYSKVTSNWASWSGEKAWPHFLFPRHQAVR